MIKKVVWEAIIYLLFFSCCKKMLRHKVLQKKSRPENDIVFCMQYKILWCQQKTLEVFLPPRKSFRIQVVSFLHFQVCWKVEYIIISSRKDLFYPTIIFHLTEIPFDPTPRKRLPNIYLLHSHFAISNFEAII